MTKRRMRIDEWTVGRVTVLIPRGRLTVETFGELRSRVSGLAEDGPRRVVLNLSAGLGR